MLHLKDIKLWVHGISTGNSFHSSGAANLKPCVPYVTVLDLETVSKFFPVDLKGRPGTYVFCKRVI